LGLRDSKCKTAICFQTKKSLRKFRLLRDSKWKNAIPFKLMKIHLFGFERFNMEKCSSIQTQENPRVWV
jgi:hypothetical protein